MVQEENFMFIKNIKYWLTRLKILVNLVERLVKPIFYDIGNC